LVPVRGLAGRALSRDTTAFCAARVGLSIPPSHGRNAMPNVARPGLTRRRLIAGTASAAALVAAPAVVRAHAATLKIAVLLPRSGLYAQAGQSCHRGALIAPKVLADYGYKVDLVHVDFESNVDLARTQAERVINDGAHCIVGAFESGATTAIAQ